MNWAWVLFFLVCGAANIVVAYRMPEAAWVNFKLFGLTSMSIVFMVAQVLILRNHLLDPPEEGAADDIPASVPVTEPEA